MMAPETSHVFDHVSGEENTEEAFVFADGEEVVRQIVWNGCRNFKQLAQLSSLSKHFYELVSTSLESWRLTARNMSESGQHLTQNEANKVLLVNAGDIRGISPTPSRDLLGASPWTKRDPIKLLEAALSKHGGHDGLNRARKKRMKRKRANLEKKVSREEALVAAMCRRDPGMNDGDALKLLKRFKPALAGKEAVEEAASAVLEAAENGYLFNDTLRKAVSMWCRNRQEAEAKYGHISTWNTSRVTSMKELFSRRRMFNDDISRWNTSNVTTMDSMFHMATSFNQPIGEWDTSKVISMVGMFCGSRVFNQPLGRWDTSKVTSMGGMFSHTLAFNHPIGGWDTSNVTNMVEMFWNASSFNQPIDQWDTSNVRNMQAMFNGASSFNQPFHRRPNLDFFEHLFDEIVMVRPGEGSEGGLTITVIMG